MTLGKVDFGGQSRLDFGQSRLSIIERRLCFSDQRQRRFQTKDVFGHGEMNFIAASKSKFEVQILRFFVAVFANNRSQTCFSNAERSQSFTMRCVSDVEIVFAKFTIFTQKLKFV